jgi:hypothetical protein
MAKITNTEIALLLVMTVFMIFTSLNVNQTLGFTFAIISIASGVFILFDKNRETPFRKDSQSIFGSLLGGVLGYVTLIVIGGYLLVPGINKLVALLQSTTPVLSTNPQINFIIFGFAVPIIESMFFFGVLADLGSDFLNTKISRENLFRFKTWILIFLISLIFMLFHLTSKGITAYATLGLVFFMAVISMILVYWFESYEAAVYFHIIANTITLI